MEPVSASNAAGGSTSQKSLSEKLTFWVGIIGSLVTIILTGFNAYTKQQIDGVELRLKERSTNLEAYKWVFTLVSSLDDKDNTKRTIAANTIRLALTKPEQEQFFAGLQASSDKRSQDLGQSGLEAIQNQGVAILVLSLNAPETESRKKAAAVLQQNYTSSPTAIELVLRLYDQNNIKALSADGLINGLYYLNRTEAAAWNPELIVHAKLAIAEIQAQKIGQTTQKELNNFIAFLTRIERGQ
jgi:hypothetical protein